MKSLVIFLIFTIVGAAHAWDFSFKANAQRASTDNVNLTNTNPISDSYTTLNGYLQTKNDQYKIKLKGKVEKYQKKNENDNYATDLSLQYKHTKTSDYTFGVFKQVYNGATIISTDTTSDNAGARISANYSNDFDKETSGYFTVTGTYKKYSKIAGRNDKILNGALGLEHYFTQTFMINPELNVENNSSADSYYSYLAYGPTILLSYMPTEKLELFINGSYAHSSYSGRNVSMMVKNRLTYEKEYQNLTSADFGAVYDISELITLQAKYSTGNNTSNNPNSSYRAQVTSFDIGLRY